MPRLLLLCRLCWLLFLVGLTQGLAQDTAQVLTTRLFKPSNEVDQQINLATLDGWVYKEGNNPAWAVPGIPTTDWQRLKPSELSVKKADQMGKVEGWFRLKFRLDSSFRGVSIGFYKNSWAALDLYVDGKLLASFGNTGTNGEPYAEHNPYFKPALPVQLTPEGDHLLAIHLVDHVSPYSAQNLKSELENANRRLLLIVGPQAIDYYRDYLKIFSISVTLWATTALILTILFGLLSFLKLYEQRIIRLLAIWGSLSSLASLGFFWDLFEPAFKLEVIIYRLSLMFYYLSVTFLIIPSLRIFGYQLTSRLTGIIITVSLVTGVAGVLITNPVTTVVFLLQIVVFLYYLLAAWKRLKGAQWAVVVGVLLTFLVAVLFSISVLAHIKFDATILFTGIVVPLPLCFLVYIALRFREILVEDRAKAAAVVQITEEKRAILATQNQLLEQQVEARTAELKASQAQLIQKEKLASLGELTAGIAHEIQNPLNFVNNFSEVSTELVEELEEEQHNPQRDPELEAEILGDLKQNLLKITQHGSRAASIIKGMLAHSRPTTGEVEPTDLNALANEYLRLSYQGLRAKDKNFSCELVTQFDPTLSSVELVPQEIGRVLLNLFNNAFYAVRERQKQADSTYQPRVTIRTTKTEKSVEMRVSDNGTGIPQAVHQKIFQPFFTTKPTGEGTGLGLSLSYDIITKGHQGSLQLISKEGQGTEFIIELPLLK